MSERLHDAVAAFAPMVEQMEGIADHVFTGLSCTEAEALADIFRAADHTEAARVVIEEHALGDDEGDLHGSIPEGCACARHADGSTTTMLCPLHADTDPCLTKASVTGKRRKVSIRRGVCSSCGWTANQ